MKKLQNVRIMTGDGFIKLVIAIQQYPEIGPTFNYAPNDNNKTSDSSIAHYYFDMLPYYWWGECTMKEMNKKNALKLIGKASLLAVVSFVLSCLFWLGLLVVMNMERNGKTVFPTELFIFLLEACAYIHIVVSLLYSCFRWIKEHMFTVRYVIMQISSVVIYTVFMLLLFPLVYLCVKKYVPPAGDFGTDFALQVTQVVVLKAMSEWLLVLFLVLIIVFVYKHSKKDLSVSN